MTLIERERFMREIGNGFVDLVGRYLNGASSGADLASEEFWKD